MNKKFSIVISGPTATGKTDFATNLANDLPIEIVNADIGSFYTSLTVGTAKPAWKDSPIPHHFFDVIDDTTSWTAPQFREKLELLLQQIWSRGNIPVIVGGSAFYIQAFFYKNHELLHPTTELMQSLESQSAQDLWEQLNEVDPARSAKIDPHDHYRLVRALAIWHTQGQKPSDFVPIFQPLSSFYFLTLTRDRDQLYDMINQRVQIMMQAGWLQEVQELARDAQWKDFLLKKKMIGYDILLEYLQTPDIHKNLDESLATIAQLTRNYAKRQITFLHRLQKNVQESLQTNAKHRALPYEIKECNLTLCDLSLYIKQLSDFALGAQTRAIEKKIHNL
ncbi:tRNA (adenosine(37)-N6)-dimethylallyltransferase MiaA [Candidatus Chromulinivorax destructor]|nr:tRNA (adenosine(37)-N6)-dimethylallyltransferase MiaA [Candidatus Chromulinivorax destructor]